MISIGDLSEICGEINFEWKIDNFFQLTNETDKCYESPEFSFCGISWVIWICPNGDSCQGTSGWIDLYVVPLSMSLKHLQQPITVEYSFHFKTSDGKADTLAEWKDTHKFDEPNYGWGCPKFISIPKLRERKSELLPSGTLTVICTMKKSNTNSGADVCKLQQQLREILQNGDISDVILKVKDQEFKSHRCILAARSPVFSAMLKNKMKENVTGIVVIQDIDSEIFSVFLNYLYTGSIEDLTQENVTKLYSAANKYQVELLKKSCLDHMLMNVSAENFCDIFIVSLQHDEEKLKETCIQYFAEHSLEIIQTCEWQSFLCENPIEGNELLIKHLQLNKECAAKSYLVSYDDDVYDYDWQPTTSDYFSPCPNEGCVCNDYI